MAAHVSSIILASNNFSKRIETDEDLDLRPMPIAREQPFRQTVVDFVDLPTSSFGVVSVDRLTGASSRAGERYLFGYDPGVRVDVVQAPPVEPRPATEEVRRVEGSVVEIRPEKVTLVVSLSAGEKQIELATESVPVLLRRPGAPVWIEVQQSAAGYRKLIAYERELRPSSNEHLRDLDEWLAQDT